MSSLDHRFDPEVANMPGEVADMGTGTLETGTAAISWIDRFPIATKLRAAMLSNAIILIAISVTILAAIVHFSGSGRNLADMAGMEVRTAHAALKIGDAASALRENNFELSPVSAAMINSDLAEARDHIAYTRDWVGTGAAPEIQQRLAEFENGVADAQTQMRALTEQSSSTEIQALHSDLTVLRADMADFARNLRQTLQPVSVDLFASLKLVVIVLSVLVVIAIAGSFAASRAIASNVVGKLREITSSMEDLAQGDTDCEIPGEARRDEIGAMARALAVFRKSSLELRSLNAQRASDAEAQLVRQQSVSQQMRDLRIDKSQLLEGLADGFEVSVGELITSVSAASEQLKATSRQMVDLADGSNDQAKSAAAAMESATANVTAAAAATDEFALSINEISRQAASSAALARDASNLVTNANTRMTDLSVAAVEIGEIVELIQTIAQRTNLLALNASIEAARGGEAGRGFAVVASEVKELAMQTSNATSNITGKITAMQDSTKSSAGDLTSIVERIGELEHVAVTIASAVEQQSVSGEELARNIDTVAAGSAQVGDRLRALRDASEETGTAADDVVASANSLGAHADDLRAKAGRFIADVRRSARDLDTSDYELEQA